MTAGTLPYLAPFLDAPDRGRYDSAAERYSAGGTQAVTAHEIRDRVRARFAALPPWSSESWDARAAGWEAPAEIG